MHYYLKNCASAKPFEIRVLVDTSKALHLPFHTICTSLFMLHRYTTAISNQTNNMEIELFAVIVGCLSLAMKVEETVKKLPDIITCCRTSINQSPINDQKEYKVIKDKIMAVERILLEDLEFNVQIQIPHRWALSLCQTLQGIVK